MKSKKIGLCSLSSISGEKTREETQVFLPKESKNQNQFVDSPADDIAWISALFLDIPLQFVANLDSDVHTRHSMHFAQFSGQVYHCYL